MSSPNFATWKPENIRKLIIEMSKELVAALPDEALAPLATETWSELQELARAQEAERKG